jgi:hypothetical protein
MLYLNNDHTKSVSQDNVFCTEMDRVIARVVRRWLHVKERLFKSRKFRGGKSGNELDFSGVDSVYFGNYHSTIGPQP